MIEFLFQWIFVLMVLVADFLMKIILKKIKYCFSLACAFDLLVILLTAFHVSISSLNFQKMKIIKSCIILKSTFRKTL